MKNITKSLILASTFATIATNVFADFRDTNMGHRYRERYRNMDICQEIKEDLLVAEERFLEVESRMNNMNGEIRSQEQVINSRTYTLENKRNRIASFKREIENLTDLKNNKDRLMSEHQNIIDTTNPQIPLAQTEVDNAQGKVNKHCGGFWRGTWTSGKCRSAKSSLTDTSNHLANLTSKVKNSQSMISRLHRVEKDLSQANENLVEAKVSFNEEMQVRPSIEQLQTRLGNMVQRRSNHIGAYNQAEQQYGRLEIRAEKCMQMQYDARKLRMFKGALKVFASNNGAGCERAVEIMRKAKGPAQKEGVDEAYHMICESDLMVQEVVGECIENRERRRH